MRKLVLSKPRIAGIWSTHPRYPKSAVTCIRGHWPSSGLAWYRGMISWAGPRLKIRRALLVFHQCLWALAWLSLGLLLFQIWVPLICPVFRLIWFRLPIACWLCDWLPQWFPYNSWGHFRSDPRASLCHALREEFQFLQTIFSRRPKAAFEMHQ